jgi:hypothetical protein
MSRVLQVPGWSNIFTQPIINRIEMLSTGVRTDIGVKVFGPDLETIDRVCKEVEAVLKPVSGAKDVVATQIMGKGYIDIQIKREEAARYGISVEDVQSEIEMAMAGRAVTVLERIATPDGRRLLAELASGANHLELSRGGAPPQSVLTVELTGRATQKYGPRLSALDLARLVHAYWKTQFP